MQDKSSSQIHTDPRKEASTVVAAWWPIAGWIPLGVENVTPRLTKSLGLKRQLSRPADPLPQLSIGAFVRWGIPGSFCSRLTFSNEGSPLEHPQEAAKT